MNTTRILTLLCLSLFIVSSYGSQINLESSYTTTPQYLFFEGFFITFLSDDITVAVNCGLEF